VRPTLAQSFSAGGQRCALAGRVFGRWPAHSAPYALPVLAPARVSLKLYHEGALALPPDGLRATVAAAFPGAHPGLFAPAGAPPPPLLALEACVPPGCTLLTAHALADAEEEAHGHNGDAEDADDDARGGGGWGAAQALQAVLLSPGAGGAFLRARRRVALAQLGGGVAVAANGVVLLPPPAADDAAAVARRAPLLRRASPLAALCTEPLMVTWQGAADTPSDEGGDDR
jgi:hypothetical protein